MLESAKIWFIDGYLEIIERLLISCVNLKKLIIEPSSISGYWNSTEAKPLFDILVNKANNLNELHLMGIFDFSSKDLFEFFENWKRKIIYSIPVIFGLVIILILHQIIVIF